MDVITRFYNLQDFSGGNNIIYNPKQIGETQTQRTMNLVPITIGYKETHYTTISIMSPWRYIKFYVKDGTIRLYELTILGEP